MALSENQAIKDIKDFTRYEQAVASGAIHFYKNAICNFNTSGYVKLGADTASEKFAGIALEELNQATGGSNGDNDLLLIPAKSGTVVELELTGVAVTDIGEDAYVAGDDLADLAADTTNDVRIGTIVALAADSNKCYIKLD